MTVPGPEDADGSVDWRALQAEITELQADRAALSARVAALDERVEELAGALDIIEDVIEDAAETLRSPAAATEPVPVADTDSGQQTPSAAPPASDPGSAPLDMRVLIPWVRDHIALLLERKIPQSQGRLRWCRSWWLHPEAIARFDALHRSWCEAVASQGNALVVYYEHLDRQLATVMDEHGPFSACTGGEHGSDRTVRRLGQLDPPPAYFVELDQFDAM